MSDCATVAQAVVNLLNNMSSSDSWLAELKMVPVYDMTQVSGMSVYVVPKAVEYTMANRNETYAEYQVDIGIMQKVTNIDTDVPALIATVKSIVEYLRKATLSGETSVYWLRTANDPIYDPVVLNERRVFLSVITVSYRGIF